MAFAGTPGQMVGANAVIVSDTTSPANGACVVVVVVMMVGMCWWECAGGGVLVGLCWWWCVMMGWCWWGVMSTQSATQYQHTHYTIHTGIYFNGYYLSATNSAGVQPPARFTFVGSPQVGRTPSGAKAATFTINVAPINVNLSSDLSLLYASGPIANSRRRLHQTGMVGLVHGVGWWGGGGCVCLPFHQHHHHCNITIT